MRQPLTRTSGGSHRLARVLLLLFVVVLAACAPPQTPPQQGESLRPPDVIDASYGPHARNVLDLWKASSEEPTPLLVYMHGGGFLSGDKSNLPPQLLRLCLEAGVSVATINYRYVTDAPYPAPMRDGARAIQFLRLHASEWNLDPERIAAAGGSAGGGMSLWVAFHDDLRDLDSDDPVARQSTRLSCAAGVGAQSTYDPRVMAEIIGEFMWQHPGFEPFFGMKKDEWSTPRAHELFEDASPSNHLSADDPPALLLYDRPNEPLPENPTIDQGAHHPRFGEYLREKAAEAGVEVVVRSRDQYSGPDPDGQMLKELLHFLKTDCGF